MIIIRTYVSVRQKRTNELGDKWQLVSQCLHKRLPGTPHMDVMNFLGLPQISVPAYAEIRAIGCRITRFP